MSREQIKTTDWLTKGMTEEQIEREKQEAIMSADLEMCHTEGCYCGEIYTDYDATAEKMYAKGYRKQSENMVDIETVKKWLYEMAINNVGCILEGDFSTACELIISRLDGLKRFAEETKGGAE